MFLSKSLKKFLQLKIYVWLAFVIILFAFLVPLVGKNFLQGDSQQQSYSMVKYIEEVNETVFLNVGVQSVETKSNTTKIPWTDIGIPLSEKKAIIVLNYDAKLGIKQPVKITETGENQYKIEVPSYEVIGVELDENHPYQLYDSRGELLSYSTKEVDTGELVTQRLSSTKQQQYLQQYKSQMDESARNYYQTLFKPLGNKVKLDITFPE